MKTVASHTMNDESFNLPPNSDPRPAPGDAPPTAVKLFRSEELFGGDRLICIEHAGAVYRLQITSRGKLILQK
jgi:hemin uptake protein HemP